jgi:hypothetical protein
VSEIGRSATVLLISSLFEGFAWRVESWLGLGLSIAGNLLALREAQSFAIALPLPQVMSLC